MKHMPAAESMHNKPGYAQSTGKNGKTRRQKTAKKRSYKKIRRIMAALLIIALMVSIIVISAAISYDYVIKNHHDASTRPEIVIDESEGVNLS